VRRFGDGRDWFFERRFGLFVHWGVYSVLGEGEWAMNNKKITVEDYEKLPPKFNPTKFDPAEWVSTVKHSGMRYITITSKHHDGFAMFHSKATPYNIYGATPFQRDPPDGRRHHAAAQAETPGRPARKAPAGEFQRSRARDLHRTAAKGLSPASLRSGHGRTEPPRRGPY